MKQLEKWIVSGGELPRVLVFASSLDNAIRAAQKVNRAYCSGHIMNDSPLSYWDEYAMILEG